MRPTNNDFERYQNTRRKKPVRRSQSIISQADHPV